MLSVPGISPASHIIFFWNVHRVWVVHYCSLLSMYRIVALLFSLWFRPFGLGSGQQSLYNACYTVAGCTSPCMLYLSPPSCIERVELSLGLFQPQIQSCSRRWRWWWRGVDGRFEGDGIGEVKSVRISCHQPSSWRSTFLKASSPTKIKHLS